LVKKRKDLLISSARGRGNADMGSHFKSVAKAVTWRVLGAADTFVLSFFVTGKATAACGIVGFELFTKSVLYYGHERAWENCSPIRLNPESREAVRRARQCWPLRLGFRRNSSVTPNGMTT
jgi:uncharacterized membrane protein